MLHEGPIEALRLEMVNSYRALVRETPGYENVDSHTRLLLFLAKDLAKLPPEPRDCEGEEIITTSVSDTRVLNYGQFFSYCISSREVTNPDGKTTILREAESKIFLPLILNCERVVPYEFLELPFAMTKSPNQNFRVHLGRLRERINDQMFEGNDGQTYWWYIQKIAKKGLELRVKRPGMVLW